MKNKKNRNFEFTIDMKYSKVFRVKAKTVKEAKDKAFEKCKKTLKKCDLNLDYYEETEW